jgi:hypothetical protein
VKIRISQKGIHKIGNEIYLFAHTGLSMNPTLASSDLLEVRPYREKLPCCGDVVIFQPDGYEQPVAHRIVRLSASGIFTRGDNGSADDPWQIQPDEVFGQVIAACRSNNRRQIAGGAAGRLRASRLRWQKAMYRAATWMPRMCRDLYINKFLSTP